MTVIYDPDDDELDDNAPDPDEREDENLDDYDEEGEIRHYEC